MAAAPQDPQSPQTQSSLDSQPESVQLAHHVAARLAEFATDVVLCPGSRNAPLSLAVIAHPGLRVHVRVDERSAAFLALGLARVQQRPVAVVMTSGSAVANCLPAVVAPAHAHTPPVRSSADRHPTACRRAHCPRIDPRTGPRTGH